MVSNDADFCICERLQNAAYQNQGSGLFYCNHVIANLVFCDSTDTNLVSNIRRIRSTRTRYPSSFRRCAVICSSRNASKPSLIKILSLFLQRLDSFLGHAQFHLQSWTRCRPDCARPC